MESANRAQPRLDELLFASLTDSSRRSAIGPSVEWTGAESLARSGGAAAHLEATGVAWDRPVLTLLESSPRSLAYLVAGVLGDRPLAPLNPRAPLTELGPVVAALGASAMLSESHVVGLAREVARRPGDRRSSWQRTRLWPSATGGGWRATSRWCRTPRARRARLVRFRSRWCRWRTG
jgi:acyl-CoA synthetase (AMP-forming)/AMP-acid ligase II